MKPKNFPERKQERRRVAYARLQQQYPNSVPLSREYEYLFLKNIVDKNMRDVRTKKDRSKQGRRRRND